MAGVDQGTSNSEPLMRHRKDRDGVKTGFLYRVQDEAWEKPAYCPSGLRCKSGVTLLQAFARDLGTCRSDDKGEAQVEDPQGREYRCGAQGRTNSQ